MQIFAASTTAKEQIQSGFPNFAIPGRKLKTLFEKSVMAQCSINQNRVGETQHKRN